MGRAKYKYGFTIAEILIALAITGILMAAVAVALNASAMNYRENEKIFKAVNCARQALFRITTQLRTAQAVDPNSPNNECTLITADGDDITYRYDGDQDTLYLVTNDDLSDSDYVLCENIPAMTFTRQTVTEDMVTYVKSVQISITVANGDFNKTLSAAAVIRRNLD